MALPVTARPSVMSTTCQSTYISSAGKGIAFAEPTANHLSWIRTVMTLTLTAHAVTPSRAQNTRIQIPIK